MTKTPSPWVRRFEIGISIMIAAITMISAVVAWRAALAADIAGNADFAGLSASIYAEETRVLSSATTYQQYRAYTIYLRNNELGNVLNDDIDSAPEEEQTTLANQRTASWDQTIIDDDFFETRYLKPGGGYDTQRQLSEAQAQAALDKDIDPEPHFSRADRQRTKSTLLVGLLIVAASALWFYTLASEIKHFIRYPLAFLGTICVLVTLVGTIAIEVL